MLEQLVQFVLIMQYCYKYGNVSEKENTKNESKMPKARSNYLVVSSKKDKAVARSCLLLETSKQLLCRGFLLIESDLQEF